MTIVPKIKTELQRMEEGGKMLGRILSQLLKDAKPGVVLQDLETMAQDLIAKTGGTPSFQTVKGYRWATCLCINDVVVHGVPSGYKLNRGDVLTIDIGLIYKGLHTDMAWTKVVGGDKEKEKFLKTGIYALENAIKVATAGNRIGHISKAIEETIEGAGYSIVKSLVGHGVGAELHEPPQVPGFVRGSLNRTELLIAGMTIAIEVIYAKGKGAVVYANDDGWSIATADGSLSAVFEYTIAVRDGSPLILTKFGK
ncbi:MAG: hypothetical protein ACD_81C00024G0004 [uncultured bacterium]|uniref:Methionine aminopeptidase n=1 Tax=Candidatus Gottesmanbacteria bacterium RIFCSPLOWO2_01_FULL_43_11b TaxID=1798392 RepID=A0A1F6AIJ9_9BACT|nr:MAG: hypothetical protein ACD_81C00024G0004 [uncultured bacterium]OGG24302.1 MAG: type I methionyl aminopeptidase [Candidatus Gottesmanbacteria bacterium RIFCSPLOWO2_01_FULL_43_11b]